MTVNSKLPDVKPSIFSVMSALANEEQAINLSQGFPDFDTYEALKERMHHHLLAGHNQYAPMAGLPLLRERIIAGMNSRYGLKLEAATDITITSGATQALFTAISTLVAPGDEVILFEPAYDSYRPAVEVMGGVVKSIGLTAPDYRVDWEACAKLVTTATTLIIINTPHNPTGTVWDTDDWRQLTKLAVENDLFVLSDEVYEHLVYDGQERKSALQIPELQDRTLATYSFGKSLHATGWKIGYCVGAAHLMSEFQKIHQFNVFSVHTPTQYALADFLEDPLQFDQLAGFYQQKRDFLQHALADTPLRPLPCQGTYFQLYDYSAASDLEDVAFAKWLTKTHKVATIPLSPFYGTPPGDKVVRICFAKRESTLAKAAEQLKNL